jgi:hypothetical protein
LPHAVKAHTATEQRERLRATVNGQLQREKWKSTSNPRASEDSFCHHSRHDGQDSPIFQENREGPANIFESIAKQMGTTKPS